MKIKCIALDLDGTVLDGRGELSQGNKEALEEAAARGIEVVVASGRSLHSLPEEITTLVKLLNTRIEVRHGKITRLEISMAPIIRMPRTMVTAVSTEISIL